MQSRVGSVGIALLHRLVAVIDYRDLFILCGSCNR